VGGARGESHWWDGVGLLGLGVGVGCILVLHEACGGELQKLGEWYADNTQGAFKGFEASWILLYGRRTTCRLV
jgi:hypothetical protein